MRGWASGLTVVLLAVIAAGCDRQPSAAQMQAPEAAPMAPGGRLLPLGRAQQGPGLHLAYTHEIGLEMAGGVLAAHFAAARDACLDTASLHCLLLHADIAAPRSAYPGSQAPVQQNASLVVRLPHDQVAAFTGALTAPLAGEAAGLVRAVRQSSTADDLGQPVADASQRVAQLTDYLASLKVLGARLTISVSDQVKIAEETAQAQTQLEEAQARQRELALRVDTEEVDVGFSAVRAPVQEGDPVARVWGDAQARLASNAADALAFGIAAVPWVPVGLAGLVVLFLARRLVFGRRRG